MAHDPELVRVDRAGVATRPGEAVALDAMRRSREIYGYITEVTEIEARICWGDYRTEPPLHEAAALHLLLRQHCRNTFDHSCFGKHAANRQGPLSVWAERDHRLTQVHR